MVPRSRRRLLFAGLVTLVAACGSKTGLLVGLEEQPDDGGTDAAFDVIHRDARRLDAGEEDGLPPIDVVQPVDIVSDCPDAASTLIYAISEANNLYSFYPPMAAFNLIGTIACPAPPGDQPFSMAVDRNGIAYVVFSPGGELFRVSTKTAACQPTTFQIGQRGFSPTFGMGFSKDLMGTGETLYVASDPQGSSLSQLGTIDTTTFQLNVVGTFDPPINRAELTGTGGGQLFAFYQVNGGADSAIGQIDKTTAAVTNESVLTGVGQGSGWAFAFWGGNFYTFTAPGGSTIVTRYNVNDGTIAQVASTPGDILVGAGVSTCAPQM